MENFIFLFVGGAMIGGVVAYWFVKFRLEAKYSHFKSEAELKNDYVLREIYENLQRQTNDLRLESKQYQRDYELVSKALAAKEQFADNLTQKLTEQKKELITLQERFKLEFENIANRLLEEKSSKFTQQNHDNLNNLLEPLKEKIKNFEEKIERTYLEETKDRISLKEEIIRLRDLNAQLSADALQLTNALKGDSKTQGDWGEFQLELLLEKSGLTKNIHFTAQTSFKDEKGNQKRPDFIINLPDGKHLVIDSKVSLTAYEAYFNTADKAAAQVHLKAHLDSLRNHIKDLASKNYQSLYNINSPDYLLLFVPIEPAFTVAIQTDANLFLEALDKNIVLVTTTTLLATMRTVAYIWKQEKQKQNVLEIARQSGFLYDKFCAFIEDLEEVGRRLDAAQNAHNAAMNKLTESKKFGDTLIGRAERIKQLGANTSKNLPQNLLDKVEEELQ